MSGMKALQRARDGVQTLLDRHNPGEKLSWAVTAEARKIPERCLREIEAAGPSLQAFYRACQDLFRTHEWIRRKVEKRYHPNYRRLNDAQPDALPWNPRPDIVPDLEWNPRFVELDITVGSRSNAALMGLVHGIPRAKTSLQLYAEMLRRRGLTDRPLVLLSAYHPAYADLLNDARAYASLLREAGANAEVLTDEDLPYLSYREGVLRLLRPGRSFEFTHFDRLIDIFEIAETAHPGMRPLLEAYLDGVAIDVNTCKQFLDEKLWLALFWERELKSDWLDLLGEEHFQRLRRLIPYTAEVRPDARVRVDGDWVRVDALGELKAERRRFVTKESGTSETAGAAQSFQTLHTMSKQEVREHLDGLFRHGPPSIIQELVESARVDFDAIDPDSGERMKRKDARVKMTAFYIDGRLGDVLFVASNKQYAVHDDDFCETVVARR